MICQVIINDFEIGKRILYILDDSDFRLQRNKWFDHDDLLLALQHNSLFAGRTRWADLDIAHFHVMIVNMLKMLTGMDDDARVNRDGEAVARLAFLLCGIITLLQEATDSTIDLFRITRVSPDDVVYDYSATLDVKIDATVAKTGLKIVIDNDQH